MVITGLIWFPPNHWSEDVFLNPGDDWLTYEKMSQKILNGDIFLLNDAGNTPFDRKGFRQHGFLYPYFIALVHLITGDYIIPVYFIQFLLTSVILIFWLQLLTSGQNRSIFILVPFFFGIFFVVIDLYIHYTTRLLSENIVVILIVWLGFAIAKNQSLLTQGILCGLIYLFRLHLLSAGVLLFLFHLWNSGKNYREIKKVMVSFFLPFILLVSLYPLRYFALHGEFRFFYPPPSSDVNLLSANDLFSEVFQKLVVNFFIPPADYSHTFAVWRGGYFWYVLHILLVVFLAIHLRLDKKFCQPLKGMLVLLFSVTFPYLFLTSGTYGFRYSLPMIFAELTILFFLTPGIMEKSSKLYSLKSKKP